MKHYYVKLKKRSLVNEIWNAQVIGNINGIISTCLALDDTVNHSIYNELDDYYYWSIICQQQTFIKIKNIILKRIDHNSVLFSNVEENDMVLRDEPKVGEVWKNFKGNMYTILHIATNTETMKKMVIYKDTNEPELSENHIWVSPLEIFMSNVADAPNLNSYKFEKIFNLPQQNFYESRCE
jgi:hypothetical protein